MPEGTVTISKEEYESLLRDRRWLNILNEAGIDNTSAHDYACQIARQRKFAWYGGEFEE